MSDMSKSVQRRLSLQLPERAKRLEAERDEWKRRAEAAEEAYARVTAAYDEAMDRAEAAEQLVASYAETNAAQRERIKNLQAAVATAVQRAEKAEAALTAALVAPASWVPVSEQLPQPERTVLAVLRDSSVSTVVIVAQWWTRNSVICPDADYEWETTYDDDTGYNYYIEGWYEQTTTGEYSFCGPLSGAVTHWMALPALPETQP